MSRFRLIVAEALRSIGANLSTTFASVVSVLIGMLLIGVFIGIGTWLVSWSDDKKRELAVHVFLCDGPPECAAPVTKQEINQVRVFIQSDDRVKENGVKFITKERALEIQRKRTPELTENLVRNPLPASFDIVPKRGEDTGAIALAIRNAELPGVHVVRYGQEVSQRILQVARVIQIVSLVAVIVLLAASTILIANTIRLSIFARRREIEVMKLVGATNWFVRGPFMLEGLICGVIGSVLAVVLLFLGKELALPELLSDTVKDAGEEVQAWAFPAVAG